jgi:Rieske Fe-S protein
MEHHDSQVDAAARGDVEDSSTTRRGFLGFMTIVLGAVPVVGGLWATLRAGLSPAHSDKPPRIPLCKLEEVPVDGIKEIAVSYEMQQGPIRESVAKVVFVTRDPKTNAPIAMAGECTHLSCPVQKKELNYDGGNKTAPLTCPCHGGMFSRTGEPVAGPPRTPLRRLKLDTIPTKPSEFIYLLDV